MMRKQELQTWCDRYFGQCVTLHALSGDASFRRYYRVHCAGQSWIVADAPPQTEKNQAFVEISELLAEANVLAPHVAQYDLQRGFLLLSDLGDQTLLPLLNEHTVDAYYKRCLRLICGMQKVDTQALAPYNQTELQAEMALFPHWFVSQLLAYSLNAEEQVLIDKVFKKLISSALEQPQRFVHRDFHSRNLMVVASQPQTAERASDHQQVQDIATIDFQDALQGALTYDAVSLLRDCYIEWPQNQVEGWLQAYYRMCLEHQYIDDSVQFTQFKQWFDFMGLQRHLKVLGIFARLSIRDDKQGYLLDLPLVIKYLRSVLALYAQDQDLAAFLKWFDLRLQPLIAKQVWSKGRSHS